MTHTGRHRCALAGTLALGVLTAGCSRPAAVPSVEAVALAASAPQAGSAPQAPGASPEWHYEGAVGPARWGMLSPAFAKCGEGRAQSPIDLGGAKAGTVPALKASFAPASLRIAHNTHVADGINNGHTIQINYSEGDTLTVGDQAFRLVQYHFHAPSEHTVNGRHFPMEMHMVHQGAGGSLAVIGVFIEAGKANPAFEPVWANLPSTKGSQTHLASVKVDVDQLLPKVRTTYRYDGSLTTPPCSEGVKWFVMTTPIALSTAQIGRFTAIISGNNRPVQPLNGRTVATDAAALADKR